MRDSYDVHPLLAAHRSYWVGWSGLTKDEDEGEVAADADLVTYRTGIASLLLNGVLRIKSLPVPEAMEIARHRLDGVPWVWWVGADSEPGTAAALQAAGARLALTMPVMAIRSEDVAHGRISEGLTIETISDEMTLREYVAVYLAAFGRPADSLELCVEKELGYSAGSGELVRLVGRIAGQTVATCAVFIHGSVAAIYYVTTDADHRNRGIATALTAEAVRIGANRGARTATLQARAHALSVYRAMGFESVSELQLFTL